MAAGKSQLACAVGFFLATRQLAAPCTSAISPWKKERERGGDKCVTAVYVRGVSERTPQALLARAA